MSLDLSSLFRCDNADCIPDGAAPASPWDFTKSKALGGFTYREYTEYDNKLSEEISDTKTHRYPSQSKEHHL